MGKDANIELLTGLLDEAAILSSRFKGGFSNRFLSAEDFHPALLESIARIKAGDHSAIHGLWIFFAPTCSWDDFIGSDGAELGNKIFGILEQLQNN